MYTLVALGGVTALAASGTMSCKTTMLDFVYLEGDPAVAALVGGITANLAKIGIKTNGRPLGKDDKNAAMQSGDFNMVLSETWGNPYDPHSYLFSWTSPNEAHHTVLANLTTPLDDASFKTRIDAILSEPDPLTRQGLYSVLLKDIHKAYIHVPLYGKRIPS